MVETFYSILGVEPGDGTERIERAYRELVKEHHPDVSDDADAPERFKRLTTARDVLMDEDERARYDRLGHEVYVRDSRACSSWRAPSGASGGASGTVSNAASQSSTGRSDRGGPTARTSTPNQQTRGGTTAYGTAANYYTPRQRVRSEQAPGIGSVLSTLREVETALLVHALLLVSAFVVGGIFFAAGIVGALSPFVSAVLGVSMIGITLFVSALHVVSKV